MADFFVSKPRWMAVALYVIFVLRLSLNVHVPRIPIALFGHALRTPMCPDSKLRITKPIRAAVGLQGLPERQERTLWDLSAKKADSLNALETPANPNAPATPSKNERRFTIPCPLPNAAPAFWV